MYQLSDRKEKKYMKILKGVEIPIAICISYTILSIVNAVLCLINGQESSSNVNAVMMLFFCSIAVLVLSIHRLFDAAAPVVMILLQYVIAMGLVFLSVYIVSFFEQVSKDGYRDIFISFTVPYFIGGVVYYISLFRAAKRQDKLLEEINEMHFDAKKKASEDIER